jgi:hypothetical protein
LIGFVNCVAGLAFLDLPGSRLVGGVVFVVGVSMFISIWLGRKRFKTRDKRR